MTEISRERKAGLRAYCDHCEESTIAAVREWAGELRALLDHDDERDEALALLRKLHAATNIPLDLDRKVVVLLQRVGGSSNE